MNKPTRYVLCKDPRAFRAYLGPMDKHTFEKFKWIYGDKESILNHPKKFPTEEYKGFILPCFKDNPEHDLIWSAHELIKKVDSKSYDNVWVDEMVEEFEENEYDTDSCSE